MSGEKRKVKKRRTKSEEGNRRVNENTKGGYGEQ